MVATTRGRGQLQGEEEGLVPSKVTRISPDKQWKAEFDAFHNSYFVYKSIGAEATLYHWTLGHKTWFGRTGPGWKEHPADSIAIACSFQGLLPSLSPSAASRVTTESKVSHSENKLWAFGVNISFDMSGADLSNPMPGGNAVLDVRSVAAQASVRIGGIELRGDVEAQ